MQSNIVALSLFLITTLAAAGALPDWTLYENPRFGYSLSVPQGLNVVARAEDNSGLTWQTGTVRVQVYGSNNPYKIQPQRWFANVRASAGDRIVDERFSAAKSKDRWQEILFLKDGRRIHRKTFVGEGAVNTVEVSYAYKLREEKQPVGQKIIDSFRPGDLSSTH